MKIECIKEKLFDSVSKAEKLVGRNPSLPVLSCLLFEAKNNNLKIKTTNLDIGMEIDLTVKVIEEGVIAVPAQVLSGFLANLPQDKNVTLEIVNGNLSVSTQNTKTTIKTLSPEDFPTIPVVSEDKKLKINPTEFVNGLKSVFYSSANSSMRPELSSVYIYVDDETLVFCATDSFRLAEKRLKIKNIKDFGSVLIPFRNVQEIIRVLEKMKDDITVRIDKNQIAFQSGGIYLVSRVVDGIFPDYKQIIPKTFGTNVIVLKEDILNALRVANIFSDKFSQIKIRVNPKEKLFEIKTQNADVGENTNNLESAITGEELEINFNYKYVMDCFQSIESDSVSLEFNGGNKPVVIKGVSDSSFTYLVMPMNR